MQTASLAKSILLVLPLLLSACRAAEAGPAAPGERRRFDDLRRNVRQDNLQRHVEFLAGPALEGRAPGTPGATAPPFADLNARGLLLYQPLTLIGKWGVPPFSAVCGEI